MKVILGMMGVGVLDVSMHLWYVSMTIRATGCLEAGRDNSAGRYKYAPSVASGGLVGVWITPISVTECEMIQY
jgi:hypothetical protein